MRLRGFLAFGLIAGTPSTVKSQTSWLFLTWPYCTQVLGLPPGYPEMKSMYVVMGQANKFANRF